MSNGLDSIKDYLTYNPETGYFMWIKRSHRSKVKLNVPVINRRAYGYLRIKYNGVTYPTHVLAWFFHYGEFPKFNIDHINGNRMDNRICNLRDVTQSENMRNTVRHRRGELLGIYYTKRSNNWESRYFDGSKWKFIGYYNSKEEAFTEQQNKMKEIYGKSSIT